MYMICYESYIVTRVNTGFYLLEDYRWALGSQNPARVKWVIFIQVMLTSHMCMNAFYLLYIASLKLLMPLPQVSTFQQPLYQYKLTGLHISIHVLNFRHMIIVILFTFQCTSTHKKIHFGWPQMAWQLRRSMNEYNSGNLRLLLQFFGIYVYHVHFIQTILSVKFKKKKELLCMRQRLNYQSTRCLLGVLHILKNVLIAGIHIVLNFDCSHYYDCRFCRLD